MNILHTTYKHFMYACIASSVLLSGNVAASLLITEIFNNPNAVADSAGEWFEVYNTGITSVDINGWTFSDTGADSFTIGTSLLIAPNTYFVFGNNADTLTNGGVSVDYQYTGMTLANSADEIRIYDSSSTPVDFVDYDPFGSFSMAAGASIELNLSAYNASANDLGSNWSIATAPFGDGDLGTPGAPPVPVPPAVWLFGSGLLGLVGIARRKPA